MADNPKPCWNLHDTNFVIVIDRSELKDSWKKYFLVIQKILGLLVKTLTTSDKYSPLNRDNITHSIEM